MVTTDLGACEWFVWDLRRSNLIDRGQLDQVVGDYLKKFPRAEPPALAEYLVSQGILSQFQADRLLQGKTQGLVLGPYTLMDALGTGSMGTVYKALSKTDNEWYAVKVLPRRSMWNVRLARRQVRAFEQCRHPGVVPFVDVGTAGGTHYLAWPLVEGETVDKIVAERGKIEPALAATYAMQAAEALDVCHQNNLIHGLVKPSNLMVGTDGQVRILDFGIGTLLSETEGESLVDTMSTANSLTSGLDCASPESIMDPTKRTPTGDQYSLGCTLYYMLTGQVPFPEGSTVEKMMAHQVKQAVPVQELAPEVPQELVDVVDRLMQKDPEARYASATEVVEALRPLGLGGASPAQAGGEAESAHNEPAPVVQETGIRNRPQAKDNGHPPVRSATPARPSVPNAGGGRQAAPAPAPVNPIRSAREMFLNPPAEVSDAGREEVPVPPAHHTNPPAPQPYPPQGGIQLSPAMLGVVIVVVIAVAAAGGWLAANLGR
jgi:serine/threonine protein kinase